MNVPWHGTATISYFTQLRPFHWVETLPEARVPPYPVVLGVSHSAGWKARVQPLRAGSVSCTPWWWWSPGLRTWARPFSLALGGSTCSVTGQSVRLFVLHRCRVIVPSTAVILTPDWVASTTEMSSHSSGGQNSETEVLAGLQARQRLPGRVPPASPSSWGLQHSLAHGCVPRLVTSLGCLLLPPLPLPSLRRTLVIGFRVLSDNPG